jgi:hypothetical protein
MTAIEPVAAAPAVKSWSSDRQSAPPPRASAQAGSFAAAPRPAAGRGAIVDILV